MYLARVPLLLVLLMAATALGGCFGKLPAREMFRLSVEAPPAALSHGSALPAPTVPDSASRRSAPLRGALAVEPYVTPGLYGDPGIVYRVGESEYGAYPSREWAIPLGEMLGMIAESVLSLHPISTDPPVFDPPSTRGHAYVWRGTVRQFEEVNRGTQVFVAVRLDATIVRSGSDSLVWNGSASLERPVPQPTMQAIVEALSALARDATAQLATEARAALQRSTRRTAAPSP